jgi:hypothetical protein
MPRGVYDRSAARARRLEVDGIDAPEVNGNGHHDALAAIGARRVTEDEIEDAERRGSGRRPSGREGRAAVEDRDHDEGLETYGETSNGADDAVSTQRPYTMIVEIEGVSAMLFHAWNNEAVEAKGKAAKGSAEKKTDNLDTYVYRNDRQQLTIPGEYLRMSLVNAARWMQDPRSPRKSMMDLAKAALIVANGDDGNELTPILVGNHDDGWRPTRDWDYVDRRRVTVQRAGITRQRPAFRSGWRARFAVTVLTPEYIDAKRLRELLDISGKLVGLADFRPTYGRYVVVKQEMQAA